MKATEIMIGCIVTVDNPKYHPKLKDVPLRIVGIQERVIQGKREHCVNLEHINKKSNTCYDTYSQFLEFIRPIPITEEILLKCGFIKNQVDRNDPNEGFYYDLRLSSEKHCNLEFISGDKNGYLEVCLFPYEDFFRFKYFHEVQNLYKAITKKELAIRL